MRACVYAARLRPSVHTFKVAYGNAGCRCGTWLVARACTGRALPRIVRGFGSSWFERSSLSCSLDGSVPVVRCVWVRLHHTARCQLEAECKISVYRR